MRASWVVLGAAVAAALSRLPGVWWPMRPDEAGYALVAAAWQPLTDERLYGDHFLDRTPLLVGAFELAVALGSPLVMRAVAALGVAATVLLAAVAARSLARTGGLAPVAVGRTGAWTAVATAALAGNALIDPVSAKSEVLALPWVLGSAAAALMGMERRSPWLAAVAGFAAVVGVGMKQSMVGGVVLGTALLVGALVAGHPARRVVVRLALAAAGGALVPVAGVLAWALAAGVDLDSLRRVVAGFRGDALETIVTGSLDAPADRAQLLLAIAVVTGMLVLLGLVLRAAPSLWRAQPVPTAAVLAVLAAELGSLLLSGSYWTPYLFGLVPGLALATALLVVRHERDRPPSGLPSAPLAAPTPGRRRRGSAVHAVVGYASFSAVAAFGTWMVWVLPHHVPTEARLGQALARSGQPGDTLVVYGGRPDVVFASGMSSPYRHLWNLPMRTLDPRLRQLSRVLADEERRPTWLVVGVPLGAWEGFGEPIRPLVERYYELAGRACKGQPVLVREDVRRPDVVPDCD